MKRIFVGVFALTSALATSALAADLPVKAPPIVPPVVYNWTGFYAGLNGGYSWGNTNNSFATPLLPAYAYSASQSMNGWVFGGQAGYNWQFSPKWVFGLEGDIDGTGQRGTATQTPNTAVTVFVPGFAALALPTITTTTTTAASLEEKLPWLATFRGRIGVLPSDRVLLYATGGLAVGEVKSTSLIATTTTVVPSFGPGATATSAAALATANTTRAGWTVGAGIEGAFAANWTARLEYLYVDLGTLNNTFVGVGAFAPLLTSSHVTDNIVRVGVNYQFSGVVARY
jgi:outer membrane immunogenic protein